jgi:hypothetical protein
MNNKFLMPLVLLSSSMVITPMVANASAMLVNEVTEASEICMLSQQLLKDYAKAGMGGDSSSELISSRKQIANYIASIENHRLKKQMTSDVEGISQSWVKIEMQLNNEPDKKGMGELRAEVNTFSQSCEKIVASIAGDIINPVEKDVVLINNLGIELQRLSALYMMKAWGVSDANYYSQVDEILNDYQHTYYELMNADEKTVSSEVKRKLKSTNKHFIVFTLMAKSKSSILRPEMAERNANKILQETREILALEKMSLEKMALVF